jgi:HK97 family phage major capsid protein
MNNTKTYSEHLAKLNALRDEILGIKRDPTAEERKIEAEYAVAFKDMLHTGMPQNALKMGSDGSGGFLVPDTFEKKLVQGLTNENLLRRLGTVLKTTKTMKIPKVVEEGSASWIPEGEIVRVSETTFGEIVLDAYKLAKRVLVSDELLEDADFDVEDFIYQMFVHAIAKAEEAAFFTGDGNGKPAGIVYQAEVGKVIDNAADLSFDDLIDLIFSVKEPYRKNAVFILSEDTEVKLKKLGLYDGKPAWRKALNEEEPDMLLGYPVYVTNEMPDVDAGNKPILFGDFSYYWIIIRDEVSVKVLKELYYDDMQIGYIAREYLDAKLIRPEAIKVIQMT